jgi:hypothetical protein
MAAIASDVSGMSVVYDKEGVDPCKCDAHYGQRFHQRPARFRYVGADLLRGVRRAAAEAGAGQDHR